MRAYQSAGSGLPQLSSPATPHARLHTLSLQQADHFHLNQQSNPAVFGKNAEQISSAGARSLLGALQAEKQPVIPAEKPKALHTINQTITESIQNGDSTNGLTVDPYLFAEVTRTGYQQFKVESKDPTATRLINELLKDEHVQFDLDFALANGDSLPLMIKVKDTQATQQLLNNIREQYRLEEDIKVEKSKALKTVNKINVFNEYSDTKVEEIQESVVWPFLHTLIAGGTTENNTVNQLLDNASQLKTYQFTAPGHADVGKSLNQALKNRPTLTRLLAATEIAREQYIESVPFKEIATTLILAVGIGVIGEFAAHGLENLLHGTTGFIPDAIRTGAMFGTDYVDNMIGEVAMTLSDAAAFGALSTEMSNDLNQINQAFNQVKNALSISEDDPLYQEFSQNLARFDKKHKQYEEQLVKAHQLHSQTVKMANQISQDHPELTAIMHAVSKGNKTAKKIVDQLAEDPELQTKLQHVVAQSDKSIAEFKAANQFYKKNIQPVIEDIQKDLPKVPWTQKMAHRLSSRLRLLNPLRNKEKDPNLSDLTIPHGEIRKLIDEWLAETSTKLKTLGDDTGGNRNRFGILGRIFTEKSKFFKRAQAAARKGALTGVPFNYFASLAMNSNYDFSDNQKAILTGLAAYTTSLGIPHMIDTMFRQGNHVIRQLYQDGKIPIPDAMTTLSDGDEKDQKIDQYLKNMVKTELYTRSGNWASMLAFITAGAPGVIYKVPNEIFGPGLSETVGLVKNTAYMTLAAASENIMRYFFLKNRVKNYPKIIDNTIAKAIELDNTLTPEQAIDPEQMGKLLRGEKNTLGKFSSWLAQATGNTMRWVMGNKEYRIVS